MDFLEITFGGRCLKRTAKMQALMEATRPEAAEKTDAGRVAPISGSVSYQIYKLKSKFEAMGRTVMPGNCALMGATRLASGHFSAASGRVAPH